MGLKRPLSEGLFVFQWRFVETSGITPLKNEKEVVGAGGTGAA